MIIEFLIGVFVTVLVDFTAIFIAVIMIIAQHYWTKRKNKTLDDHIEVIRKGKKTQNSYGLRQSKKG